MVTVYSVLGFCSKVITMQVITIVIITKILEIFTGKRKGSHGQFLKDKY